MKDAHEFSRIFTKVRSLLLVLFISFFAFCLWALPNMSAASAGLSSLPWPFVTSEGNLNCSLVIASSGPHGPCGGGHTLEARGAISVGQKLSLLASGGELDATMDDYVSAYDFGTAKVVLKDSVSNLLVVGGPGVNQVTWYYNSLRNDSGARLLPVYFDKTGGVDCIRVASSGNTYKIEYDEYGKVKIDYGAIIVFQDSGRYILFLAGLGGVGTSASCKIISTFEDWNLEGLSAVVKCSDADGDGFLNDLAIVEKVQEQPNSGTIQYGSFSLAALSMLMPGYVATKWKAVKKLLDRGKTLFIVSFILAMICSQFLVVAFSSDAGSVFTLDDFSQPFISQTGVLNCTVVVASSSAHGPCGAAHTMDVMGAILIGTQLGLDAVTGTPASELDDDISTFDSRTTTTNFASLRTNLLVVGGPNVNQVTWHYNNLEDGSGTRIMPVYFDKTNAADCIRVPSTGHTYKVEYDQYGKVKTDYGVITLFRDSDHGVWVLVLAGLGGSGTVAAARTLASYKYLNLFGRAAVVKFSDSNNDGYLDKTSIVESVSLGKSIGVYSDSACTNPVGSMDWGTLSPGSVKNLTVFVRNEGEERTFLTLKVSNWNPPEASTYLRVEWDYKGNIIEVGQTLTLTLTLRVDPNVVNITAFSADFEVTAN